MFKNSDINHIKYVPVLTVFRNSNSPSKNWKLITLYFNQSVSSTKKILLETHSSFILGTISWGNTLMAIRLSKINFKAVIES